MIARDNDTRAALNDAARELWRALGLLGEEHTYGSVELAVGDRVICRRNDRLIDVDNGMRGTVRHLDAERVVIDTDSGLVRELPAGYVAEHVEHAYALTGHGMQGGTVEHAVVVASPRDLTAGWSYTALSRARGRDTPLDLRPAARGGARRVRTRKPDRRRRSRGDLLSARAAADARARRRGPRDRPAAGRGPSTTTPRWPRPARSRQSLAQERAALRAEPTPPPPATTARLRELRERIEQLQAQLQALPARELQRIEDLDARALTLTAQHERLAERLCGLPVPRRRLGRVHDPRAAERTNLTSALEAGERELDTVLAQRARLERSLGDPGEIRAERDSLREALAESTREHAADPRRARRPRPARPRRVGSRHFRRAPRGARGSPSLGAGCTRGRALPSELRDGRPGRSDRLAPGRARATTRLGACRSGDRPRRAAARPRYRDRARRRHRDRAVGVAGVARERPSRAGYGVFRRPRPNQEVRQEGRVIRSCKRRAAVARARPRGRPGLLRSRPQHRQKRRPEERRPASTIGRRTSRSPSPQRRPAAPAGNSKRLARTPTRRTTRPATHEGAHHTAKPAVGSRSERRKCSRARRATPGR